MIFQKKCCISLHLTLGYRDAECAWIPVQEDHHDDDTEHAQSRRTALFLIIYAPRRGILEVLFHFSLSLQNTLVKGSVVF